MHEFSSNRETLTYRYGEVETPFLQKEQNEDRELGMTVKAVYFWRILSFISLMVSFLLLLSILIEVLSPQVHVLLAVITNNGFVKDIGWLKTLN